MMNNNMYFTELQILWRLFSEIPTATAHIRGSAEYPNVKGIAQFYQVPQGGDSHRDNATTNGKEYV